MNNKFERRNIKSRAKAALSKCYWLAFGVIVVVSLILGQFPTFNLNFNFSGLTANGSQLSDSSVPFVERAPSYVEGIDRASPFIAIVVILAIVVFVVVMVALFVKSFFLDGVVSMGCARFFLGVTRGQAKFGDLFAGFKEKYFNICKVMFVRFIKLMLWELFIFIPVFSILFGALLIRLGAIILGAVIILLAVMGLIPSMIPSIIKAYEYSQIPYLLAEYPEMTTANAFAASRELTRGHKWNLFVLDLSFLGWEILAILTLGVGQLFLEPYIQASKAEAYADLCKLRYPPASTPAPEIIVTETVVEEAVIDADDACQSEAENIECE